MSGWARRVPEGWLLAVYVQPGTSRDAVMGRHGDARKVRVAAPPVEGRANARLEELIARTLGVPKRAVSVVKGGSARRKAVLVALPDADPRRLLDPLG